MDPSQLFDSESESGQYDNSNDGDWEHAGSSRQGHAQHQQRDSLDGSAKKGGKKDLSHVACRFYRVGACSAGAACPFSHAAREPGTTKTPCKWFLKGSCKFGHKCANAHVHPGQAPSMDWKNKKAAKQQAQVEAGSSGNLSTSPSSPGFHASSPHGPRHQTSINNNGSGLSLSPHSSPGIAPLSGLSNMFGRTSLGSPMSASSGGVGQHQQQQSLENTYLQAEQAVAAIGMSPIGLPMPADLALPATSVPRQNDGGAASSLGATRPKPLSYASAAATAAAQQAQALGQQQQAASPGLASAQLASTPTSALPHQSSTNSDKYSNHAQSGSTGPGASPTGRIPSALGAGPSPTSAGDNLRLSASVPSAFAFDASQLEGRSAQLSPHQQTQHSAQHPHFSITHQPVHSSPLAPPLKQSHSHSHALPSRSSLLGQMQSSASAISPGLAHAPLGSPSGSNYFPQNGLSSNTTGARATNGSYAQQQQTQIFGTSPFGNNAIFISSSHEDDREVYISRASGRHAQASSSYRRNMSPTAFNARSSGSGSYDGRSGLRRGPPGFEGLVTGSSALADEDGEEDNQVLEEELVPSSLKHLLTPDEKARRNSRNGLTPHGHATGTSVKSGFFNPFDDTEDDEADRLFVSRYSQSVPATAFQQHLSSQAAMQTSASSATAAATAGAFSKVPGSPPVSGYLGSSLTPREYLSGSTAGTNRALPTSNLAKHLLAGSSGTSSGQPGSPSAAQSGPRIERGFYAPAQGSSGGSALGTSPGGSGTRSLLSGAGGGANLAGTSLPQGLAAGLSRLHLIPAGQEHTGYTPQGSYIGSPPAGTSGAGPAGGGTGTSSNLLSTSASSMSLGPPGKQGQGGSSLVSSYNMKLPTLATIRRPSSQTLNNNSGTTAGEGHAGSPLVKTGLHHPALPPSFAGMNANAPVFGTIGLLSPAAAGKANAQTASHEHEEDELLFDMDV